MSSFSRTLAPTSGLDRRQLAAPGDDRRAQFFDAPLQLSDAPGIGGIDRMVQIVDRTQLGAQFVLEGFDLKVVVAVAAVVILVATLVLAGPLRPGPNKQPVTVTRPSVTSTTSPPSTSLPVVTTVPTTTVPIDTSIGVYGDCTSPTVEPAEIVLACADYGEVLMGLLRPDQCEAFGTRCTPEHPLGAPMVSSEGACAAYYKYGRTSRSES